MKTSLTGWEMVMREGRDALCVIICTHSDTRRRYGSTERLPRVSRSNLRSVSEANLLSSDHYTDHQDIRKIRRDFEQHGKE